MYTDHAGSFYLTSVLLLLILILIILLGYVGQEPTLFNDTIANNIAYGAPNASRKEIEEAAKQANAFGFISNFPEGFDVSRFEIGP